MGQPMTAAHDPVLHEVALILERQSRDKIALAALRVFDRLVALPAADPGRARFQTQLLSVLPAELRDLQWDTANRAARVADAVLEEARTRAPSANGIDRRLTTRVVRGERRPHPEPFTRAEFEAAMQKNGVKVPRHGTAALAEKHRVVRDVVRLTSPTGGGLPSAEYPEPDEEDSLRHERRSEPATPRELLGRVTHVDVKAAEAAVRSSLAVRGTGLAKGRPATGKRAAADTTVNGVVRQPALGELSEGRGR